MGTPAGSKTGIPIQKRPLQLDRPAFFGALPDELGATLKAYAHAHGVSLDRYISRVLETTLASEIRREQDNKPFETGYGMFSEVRRCALC